MDLSGVKRISCGSSIAFFQKVKFHFIHLKFACSSWAAMKTCENNVRMEKEAREGEKVRGHRQGSVCEGSFLGLCEGRERERQSLKVKLIFSSCRRRHLESRCHSQLWS